MYLYLYVCHTLSEKRCDRAVCHTAFFWRSTPLLFVDKHFCGVTVISILHRSYTFNENKSIFATFCRLLRKLLEISKLFQWTATIKVGFTKKCQYTCQLTQMCYFPICLCLNLPFKWVSHDLRVSHGLQSQMSEKQQLDYSSSFGSPEIHNFCPRNLKNLQNEAIVSKHLF